MVLSVTALGGTSPLIGGASAEEDGAVLSVDHNDTAQLNPVTTSG